MPIPISSHPRLDLAKLTGQASDGTHQGGIGHQGPKGHNHEEGDLQSIGRSDRAEPYTLVSTDGWNIP